MPRKRLLIISYLFPPAGGVGVQRALNFAKYLPDCGYDVHVLSATNAAVPNRDPELLRQLPDSVVIHGSFTPEIPFGIRQAAWRLLSGSRKAARPGGAKEAGQEKPTASPQQKRGLRGLVQRVIRRVLCPEPEILWVPFALRQARRIVRRHNIDVVLVTAPPFSAFLVGTALKKEFPHLKLISDFRDAWFGFYLSNFDYQSSEPTQRRAAEIEREAVETSDLVVAVTRSTITDIRNRYPEQPDSKFVVVHNGYDPQAFAGFQPAPPDPAKLVVLHVGTVYGASSARTYVDALESLPEEIRSRVETRFIGRVTSEEEAHLVGRNVQVSLTGFLPHKQALRSMEEADYLLLIMNDPVTLPGKLFEYLATGKPIIALAPRGSEVEELIRSTGAGFCAPAGDPHALSQMLHTAFDRDLRDHKEHAARRPDWTSIRKFERPRLARKLHDFVAGLDETPVLAGRAESPEELQDA
jgi:glycosyltransferase involved in cell wall biosynthesis